MLSGKRFKLTAPTLAIAPINGTDRTTTRVPAGEVITVLSGPRPDDQRLVDVLWRNKKLIMFYEDVVKRGELAKETSP